MAVKCSTWSVSSFVLNSIHTENIVEDRLCTCTYFDQQFYASYITRFCDGHWKTLVSLFCWESEQTLARWKNNVWGPASIFEGHYIGQEAYRVYRTDNVYWRIYVLLVLWLSFKSFTRVHAIIITGVYVCWWEICIVIINSLEAGKMQSKTQQTVRLKLKYINDYDFPGDLHR